MINSVLMSFEKSPISQLIKNMAGVRMFFFFTQTCIISQIMMINSVFDEFWKITHLSVNSSWPSDAILWRQHIV